MSADQSATAAPAAPPLPTLLRIEHGSPTAEELAALTLIVAAMAAGSGDSGGSTHSAGLSRRSFGWGRGRRSVRRPFLRDRVWGGW